MKLLVVGGAGYVGQVLRPVLEEQFACTHFDLRPVPGAESRTLVADVNNDAAVTEAVAGQDAVLYLAMGSRNADPRTVNEIDPAFDVNVRGLYRFLYRAHVAGLRRFVFASTLSVYFKSPRPLDESVAANAWEPYGVSKRVGEFLCQAAAGKYPDTCIVALRLMLPRNDADWAPHRYDPAREHNSCALGPQDTRRLFLAALRFQRPGCYIMQATGDMEQKSYDLTHVRDLLGWEPRNE